MQKNFVQYKLKCPTNKKRKILGVQIIIPNKSQPPHAPNMTRAGILLCAHAPITVDLSLGFILKFSLLSIHLYYALFFCNPYFNNLKELSSPINKSLALLIYISLVRGTQMKKKKKNTNFTQARTSCHLMTITSLLIDYN